MHGTMFCILYWDGAQIGCGGPSLVVVPGTEKPLRTGRIHPERSASLSPCDRGRQRGSPNPSSIPTRSRLEFTGIGEGLATAGP